jgi:hypothetical protein
LEETEQIAPARGSTLLALNGDPTSNSRYRIGLG